MYISLEMIAEGLLDGNRSWIGTTQRPTSASVWHGIGFVIDSFRGGTLTIFNGTNAGGARRVTQISHACRVLDGSIYF